MNSVTNGFVCNEQICRVDQRLNPCVTELELKLITPAGGKMNCCRQTGHSKVKLCEGNSRRRHASQNEWRHGRICKEKQEEEKIEKDKMGHIWRSLQLTS